MSSYSISVVNSSGAPAKVAIYQTYPNLKTGLPLVWLLQTINDGNTNTYHWTVDWALNWGTSDQPLTPGVEWCSGGPIQTMDPTTANGNNAMGVIYSNDQFKTSPLAFHDKKVPNGSMLVMTDTSFTVRESTNMSIAVYMNSLPAFAMPGKPNGKYIFDTHPTYWICTTEEKKGVAVSGTYVSNPKEVVFGDGINEIDFKLDETLQFVQVSP
ncbi:hypothetical protein AB3X96_41730 [Paraburkholderia sp. BR13439]|uniref:hypothetical protein n=1 Tax=unclassified Paraburkholderia TaxID=2615204 RepID=UPI0034CFD860